MAGTHKKGTNDADVAGKKGGALPVSDLDKLTKRVEKLEKLAAKNGWSGV